MSQKKGSGTHTGQEEGSDECSSAEGFLSPETLGNFSHSEQVELRDKRDKITDITKERVHQEARS